MAQPTNQEIYSTVEFKRWAERERLNPDEHFVLTTFLRPDLPTLEAGTGGGRIVRALRELGFSNLAGYDYVPGLIDEARRRDPSGSIRFEVQDATQLTYPDASWDQLIYMQQILCFIDSAELRAAAVREAWRILKPGGTAAFSFLNYDWRFRSPLHGSLLTYVRALRGVRGAPRSRQSLPWLRLGERFNWGFLADRPPYVYWYRVDEAAGLLTTAGFKLTAIGTSAQVRAGALAGSLADLRAAPIEGGIYCVCTK